MDKEQPKCFSSQALINFNGVRETFGIENKKSPEDSRGTNL